VNNMKKKIVFFSNTMNIGGMEKALLILLNSLCNEYEITLFLKKKEGVLLNKLNSNIIIKELKTSESKNIAYRKIYNFLNRQLWIIKNKNKYIFSCNYATYLPIGSVLALAASRNSLLYVHSDYYNLYNKDKTLINNFFDSIRMTQFKNVAFVSEESKKNIEHIYPQLKKKFIVLNNLFDYKTTLSESKEKINYKNDKKYEQLIYIGRLEEESKDIKYLLKLMKSLKEYNVNLIMIGNGKDKPEYEKIINMEGLSNVRMLGEKENPYPYLKVSDALILTSNFEGFPVVFSEALLLNKKIISTITVSDKYLEIDKNNALIINKKEDNIKKIVDYLNSKDAKKALDFEKINSGRMNDIINIINAK